MAKYLFIALFILGVIYLLIPGPKSINDIPGLPGAIKSDEEGDTIQNPNIVGWYGDKRRAYVANFYKTSFENLNFGSLPLPAIRLNHPPEEAYQYVRDQQQSTYLEQYFYPLRGYLFVNGYEPFDVNGKKFNRGVSPIGFKGVIYPTKVTVRFYPVPLVNRLVIYTLYWIFGLLLFWMIKKIIWEKV